MAAELIDLDEHRRWADQTATDLRRRRIFESREHREGARRRHEDEELEELIMSDGAETWLDRLHPLHEPLARDLDGTHEVLHGEVVQSDADATTVLNPSPSVSQMKEMSFWEAKPFTWGMLLIWAGICNCQLSSSIWSNSQV